MQPTENRYAIFASILVPILMLGLAPSLFLFTLTKPTVDFAFFLVQHN